MSLRANWRRFMTQDRAVLMICIGIALCFWVLNKLSNSFRRTIPVKIEYSLPRGKALSAAPPQYLQVTLQGTGWDLLMGREEKIFVSINDDDSVQVIALRNLVQQHFQGAEVTGLSNEQVKLVIEDAVARSVMVQPVSAITFAKGFDLADDIQLNPSVVTVSGPKSAVEKLKSLPTDTIRWAKLKDEVVVKVKLATNPIFTFSVDEVEAKFKAEQFTEKSLFIPIVVKNAPEKLKIFPNKIKLDCSVALSRYGQLSTANFEAEVDLRDADVNSKNNSVPILLSKQPNFVRNLKFTPKLVEFYYEKE